MHVRDLWHLCDGRDAAGSGPIMKDEHVGWIGDESVRPRAGESDFLSTESQLSARAQEKLRLEIAWLHQEKHIQSVYTKACQIDASGKNARPMWAKYKRLIEAHKWSKRRYFAGTLDEVMTVMQREAQCLEANRLPYPDFSTGTE